MKGKWFWVIVLLAVVSLLLSLIGPWSATQRSKDMGQSVQNALSANQVSGVNVEMNGNVATLSGEVASQDMLDKATNIAGSAECETCKKKGKIWHSVKNDLTVKPASAVSPYVFTAVKDNDGKVHLDGYVRNQAEKDSVIAKAKTVYGTSLASTNVRIAPGAPDANWGKVVNQSLPELTALDHGRFLLEDNQVLIEGAAASSKIRNNIKADTGSLASRFPAYNGSAKISVPKVKAGAAISPYVFKAVKDDGGKVRLDGYVQSKAEKKDVIRTAKATFGDSLVSTKIRIAPGAPNANWGKVVDQHLPEIAALDSGRFLLEDNQILIEGEAASAEIRDNINTVAGSLTSKFPAYNAAANIRVPNVKAVNVGEVNSHAICQDLMTTLKGDNRINFATDSAEITGAHSFDLLNTLSSAVLQCKNFSVRVDGHTDSVGDASYNQWLSEARANSVVAYLADGGVDLSRTQAVGNGENKPIASNDTSEGKARNRRIEFTIVTSK